MSGHRIYYYTLFILWLVPIRLFAQAEPKISNLHDLKSDLIVPCVTNDKPAPGKRVRQINPGFEDWKLAHVLYLPPEWKPGSKFPVIVEYPGNGGYQNKLGDISTGRVEDCKLGYGISGGQGFIWVCLPFVDPKTKEHSLQWWGDPEATAKYCRQTVTRICHEFGGDPNSVILTGFSRGAIACNYIGLRDDATAKLWKAMIVHSHYDGVRKWGYPEDDRESAYKRLERFSGKSQFITHENSVADVTAFLKGKNINSTIVPLPFPNHSDTWVLKDIPERKQLRAWLGKILKK